MADGKWFTKAQFEAMYHQAARAHLPGRTHRSARLTPAEVLAVRYAALSDVKRDDIIRDVWERRRTLNPPAAPPAPPHSFLAHVRRPEPVFDNAYDRLTFPQFRAECLELFARLPRPAGMADFQAYRRGRAFEELVHRTGFSPKKAKVLEAAAVERLIQTLVEGPLTAGAKRPWLDIEQRVWVWRVGAHGLQVYIRKNNQLVA